MKTIYLAGPIFGCIDSDCHDWRNRIQTALEHKYKCLNPLRHDYRGSEFSYPISSEIISKDKKDILKSDIILANCFKPSYGTAMEIFYANTLLKTVILIVPSPQISPWLIYHSSQIVRSEQQAIDYLLGIL